MPTDFSFLKCKTGRIGIATETPEFFEAIRKKKRRNLSQSEERSVSEVTAAATLLKKYGKVAAYIMARFPIAHMKPSWTRIGEYLDAVSGNLLLCVQQERQTSWASLGR